MTGERNGDATERHPAEFGGLLRGHRRAAGLTQEALAERAGLSVRGLQHLEAGDAVPARATLGALLDALRALGLPPDERARLEAAARRPGRAGGHGGPAGAAPAPGPLPAPLTTFVGRERELAAARRLLPGTRLLTLTGPAGVGKTRLALRLAADVRDAAGAPFADGARFVALAPLADPALVPQAVAAALGVPEAPGRALALTLADALRPRGLLLVLDNCEHVVAACAELADALLGACPRLTLLATSREALGLAGETVWPVPPLALPAPPRPGAQPPLEATARSEAVALFVDRARAVAPGFALTARTAPAVAGICARLDGLPLAIELAAARVRVLPPEQLLQHLEDRFRLLTGGSRTALPRQQTLRAAVDWSYALLPAGERALFARLSVFAGGFTLEAADAVGADPGRPEGPAAAGRAAPDVLDRLTRLVDQSLVEAEGQPDGTARFRLLETLRQYAQERLAASGGAGTVRRRHAAYYLALAEAAEPRLVGAEQAVWLHRLAQEYGNLLAVLRWSVDGGAGDTALRLAGALWRFWSTRGYLGEGRAWLARALALPAGPAPARAKAQYQ